MTTDHRYVTYLVHTLDPVTQYIRTITYTIKTQQYVMHRTYPHVPTLECAVKLWRFLEIQLSQGKERLFRFWILSGFWSFRFNSFFEPVGLNWLYFFKKSRFKQFGITGEIKLSFTYFLYIFTQSLKLPFAVSTSSHYLLK